MICISSLHVQGTSDPQKAVESTSRPRSRSAFEKPSTKVMAPLQSVTQMMPATAPSAEHAQQQPVHPQPHQLDHIVKHMNTDQPNASNDDIHVQHADYVNQSRIQAMIEEAMHKSRPHSAPEESPPLPPPIVNYPMDEPNMRGLPKGGQQPNFHGYVESDQTVQPSHMQRRLLSDSNAGEAVMVGLVWCTCRMVSCCR